MNAKHWNFMQYVFWIVVVFVAAGYLSSQVFGAEYVPRPLTDDPQPPAPTLHWTAAAVVERTPALESHGGEIVEPLHEAHAMHGGRRKILRRKKRFLPRFNDQAVRERPLTEAVCLT